MSKKMNCALKTLFLANARKAMKAKNITNRQLASFMQVHPVTVSRWLHGESDMPLMRIEQLSTCLNTSSYTLFKVRTPRMTYALDDEVYGDIIYCGNTKIFAENFYDKHGRVPTFRDVLKAAHYSLKKGGIMCPIIIGETALDGRVYRCFNYNDDEINLIGDTQGYA